MTLQDTRFLSATPTITAGAYTSGQLIGGKLTFTGAFKPQTGAGLLVSVRVSDKAAQSTDLKLYLFSDNPSATTFTDNSTFTIHASDIAKVIAVIDIPTTAFFQTNTTGTHYVGSLAIPVWGRNASTNAIQTTLYGALQSGGTPTFGSTGDVSVLIVIGEDS